MNSVDYSIHGIRFVLVAALLVGFASQAPTAFAQRGFGGEGQLSRQIHQLETKLIELQLTEPRASQGDKSSRQQIQQIRERIGRLVEKRRASVQSRVLGKQNLSGYETIDPLQTFTFAEEVDPKYNFRLFNTPLRAGDVNDDGKDDYLYTEVSRDERTPSDLSDKTGKTALFFGNEGSLPEEEDQFLYRSLFPSGDLDDDGFTDAISIEEGEVRVFRGSPSGYQESGFAPFSIEGSSPSASADFDGDGYSDVVIGDTSVVEVIFGAEEPSEFDRRVYDMAERDGARYNGADLGGDGLAEIVRVGEAEEGVKIEIFRVDGGDRSLTTAQEFSANELDSAFFSPTLTLPDVDGSGAREIVVHNGFGDPTFAFASIDTSGVPYNESPFALTGEGFFGDGEGRTGPVGDLDGDGREDFSQEFSVAFGPENLADSLSFDEQFFENGCISRGTNAYDGNLGDLTGDGLDDFIFGNCDEGEGRMLLPGNGARDLNISSILTFQEGRFTDVVPSTANLGDVNGDGIEDLAMQRRKGDTQFVEVFLGGDPIGNNPNFVLEAPFAFEQLVGGDFNGDGLSDVALSGVFETEIYLGGDEFGDSPDHVIDTPSGIRAAQNVGDVNDDGVDDLLALRFGSGDEPDQALLYFGGEPLPDSPNVTIDYEEGEFRRGRTAVALSDFSGDGVDDFAVMRFSQTDGRTLGEANVYFGGSASFANPDLVLTPDTPANFARANMAGGDFNGDGYGDVALKGSDNRDGEGSLSIHVFNGGTNADSDVDQLLDIPASALGSRAVDENGDGLVDASSGALVSVPPGAEDETGGLLLTTEYFGTNALLYQDSSALPSEPSKVLVAPNQDAGLGHDRFQGAGASAVGSFTGGSDIDIVISQPNDDNDARSSSRVYGYSLGDGVPEVSGSIDVSAGQTGSVPLGATGAEVLITENNDSDGGQIQFTRSNAAPPNESFDGSATAPDGSTVTPNAVAPRHWDISGSGLSDLTFEVRLGVAGADGISAPDKLLVVTRDDSGEDWTPLNTTRSGEMLVSSELTSFSSFSVAGDSTENPLPVELAGFEATVDEGTVRLTWQTASETSNARFEVQRRASEQGSWTRVGAVQGSGTTTEARSYRFADEDLPYEANRLDYRLRQIDIDGSESFSKVLTVKRGVDSVELLGTYPNPAQNRATVRYALPEQQEVRLKLYDVLGRQVRTVVRGEQTGRHKRRVDVSELASGVYFLRLEAGGETKTKKLTVVR